MTSKVQNLKIAIRLTDYCVKYFPILGSRSAAKKAIQNGLVFVNDRRGSVEDMLKNGDKVVVKRPKTKKVKKVNIEIPILFEDEYLIVVNKPAGIAVNGNRNKTVENIVAHLAQKSHQPDALPQPVAAHRIDVPTKGLVLLAKTKSALITINKSFQNNQVQKAYSAIVHGKMREKGRIDSPISDKEAITLYETLAVVPSRIFRYLSFLRLDLITGRTHQLRIHLKKAGHLIVGDKEYAGNQKTIYGKGLFLCSCELSFEHPITKELMAFKIDPPARFQRLLDREGRRFN